MKLTMCNLCTGQGVRGCHLKVQQPPFTGVLYLLFSLFSTLTDNRSFLWLQAKCDLTTFVISFFSAVAPVIHEIKSHGIGLGRTALLRCEAGAVPAPTFEWYKGEKRWAHSFFKSLNIKCVVPSKDHPPDVGLCELWVVIAHSLFYFTLH